MKRLLLILSVLLFWTASSIGQVTTNEGSGLAPTYPSLAAAITALNSATITSPVVINLTAVNPQTAPAGGYSITATGTVTNTITINGNANTITAPTPQTSGQLYDAIFKIIGGDYITIDGFTMVENAGNTTTVAGTNNMTEWGVALLYASTTNGAQNCNIQNNTITLNRTYQNTFGIYSNSTHAATTPTTSATATTTAGGNSGLTIKGNTISNVNIGIVVIGPTAAADNNDGLIIGGLANGNSISNYGTTGTFSSYANVSGTVNGILVRNAKNVNVSYNTITSSVGGVTAGTLYGIQVAAFTNAPTGVFTNSFNNNNISLKSGLIAGAMNGIYLNGTSASVSSSVNINNNDFNNFGHTVSGTGAITFIYNGGTHLYQNINNNTFTNISVNTTGSVTFISNNVTLPAAGTQDVNNNSIVTAFSKTGAGGTITFFTTNASSPVGSSVNNNGNIFSNITITGATSIAGWVNTDGGTPTKTVQNNTFNNWTGGTSSITVLNVGYSATGGIVTGNTITNITGQGAITGLVIGSSSAFNVYSNTINTLSSSGTGGAVTGLSVTSGSNNIYNHVIHTLSSTSTTSAVTGISISGATANNVYKNKVYNLTNSSAGTSTPLVVGATISGGTAINLYNNYFGNLNAGSSASIDAIRGINVTSTSTVSTINIYYNTVYVNATSVAANFGTTGIYHTANATSTTAALNLRNNIIVNLSTPLGTGLTVAYRRSLGTAGMLANYASTSNNNDFYAGTPGASSLIYYDGTSNAQTMAQYKAGAFTAGTIAPRDASSFTENPTFISTTGSSTDFLHINTSTPTQIESGGTAISGITDDYDGDVRNVTTPDVGADEFAGTGLDLTGPTISYTVLGNGIVAGTRSFSPVTITDASNVNVTAGTAPRVYYKRSVDANTYNDNTSGTDGWKYVESTTGSTPFSFTIDYSLLNGGTGVVESDVIQYFVVAQDEAGTPNVGINSGTLNAAPTSVALTAAAFPLTGTINQYTIVGTISGTKTIGTGGDYATLTGAGGLFADINAKVVTGNITATIISDITEDGSNALNQWSEAGAGNYTLTIQPDAATLRSISGSYAGGLIRLNGADRVTIDGRFSGSGNYLTLSNTSTSGSATLQIISQGTGSGATNNTIRNCNISTGSISATTYAIFAGSSALGTAADDNDNLSILNNVITKAYNGIWARSSSTGAGVLNGLSITGNTIGSSTATDYIIFRGIDIQGASTPDVSQNTIFNLKTTGSLTVAAIDLGQYVTNATVNRNNIYGLRSTTTSGFGAHGINISSGTGTTGILIANNTIYDIITSNYSSTSTLYNAFGIRITGGTNHMVYYNSVNLYGTVTGGTNAGMSSCFIVTSNTATGLDVRNNVFMNSTAFAIAGSKSYGAYAVTGVTFSTINYNDYFGSGTYGILGYYGADKTTLADWQTSSAQDVNSLNSDPLFVSETNLQPFSGSPILAAGTPVSVTIDYTGASRSGTTPSMGAYESGQVPAAIDWANMQSPAGGTITEGGALSVYARAYEPGVTEAAGPGAGIECWIGWGTVGTNPNTWTNWTVATFNDQAGNNDEFVGTIGSGITAGTYDYAARWRITGGSYQYGGYSGGGGGFWDGVTYTSGTLTVNPFTITIPYSQGFESVTFPPTAWSAQSVLGAEVWSRSTASFNSGVASAAITYQTTGGEDWLITPKVMSVVAGDQLAFYWKNKFGSAFPPDQLDVLVSTTDALLASFTTTLGTINTGILTPSWVSVSYSLDAFAGQNIYIAFKHTDTDGNGIYLDDVVLSNLNTIWTGTTSTDWTVAGNWSNGVPTSGMNVTIADVTNNPVIATAVTLNNLTINSGGVLTIGPSGQLTVTTALTNNAGNGGLVIQSDATGTGSLKHNSNGVNATIQRYITNNTYHFVSVPLTSGSNPTAALFTGSYLWKYDPSIPNWVKYLNASDALTVTQGYLINYPGVAATTYTFTGAMNNGAMTLATPAADGLYNLVPNPYPSNIDWTAASGWTKTNIANAVYVYNSTQYASYIGGVGTNGGSNIIPVGQAFFVMASGGTGTLALNNSVRSNTTQAFFDAQVINNLMRINVSAGGNGDETVIRFQDESTSACDDQYDANKIYGASTAPQLYSISSDDKMLSINALPLDAATLVVPLAFEYTVAGDITLNFSGFESYSPNVSMFLEDLLTGTLTDLRAQPSYTFNHQVENSPDRFRVHFLDVTGESEIGTHDYTIWTSDKKIYIDIPALFGERAVVEMFDVLGNTLLKSRVSMEHPTVIQAINTGVAVVRVTSGNRVYTSKLFIQ
ncbi:MAG: choice-of-anchor J domain-containing protein [Bacteroidales bacterium]|nr:choice-of-anchor J domain-containing protein [Bacteroidales bacterium]